MQLPPELLRELQPPPLPQDGFVVWPEHRRAVEVFPRVRFQLRYGPGGPCGFDAAAVEAVMRLLHVPPRRRAATFDQLMVMEGALLDDIYSRGRR